MTYEEWETEAQQRLGKDTIWRMRVYRVACYLAETAWPDARALVRDPLTQRLGSQLIESLGSVRANLGEGYGRSAGRDRARIYEYFLGSAREAREWYRHTSPVLGDARVKDRCQFLDEIIRLLLTIIPQERDRKITPADESDVAKPRHPRPPRKVG